MSCKLWGKCFCQYQFCYKNVNFVRKELKFGRNVDFFIKCGLLLKVIIFLQNVLISRKKWLLVWRFIYSDKKNFNFFGYVNLYMCKLSLKYFICRIIVILIQNIILCNDILCKRHFPSKIYIILGINSLEKLSNFLRKVLI